MMNKIIVTILLLSNIGILNAQYTAIPDPYFEQNLIDRGIDSEGILDGQVLTSDIETVTSLLFLGPNIQDLTGVEDFIALEELDCSNNEIQHLDVSQNYSLVDLDCNNNYLTSINLSGCINLKKIHCGFNDLSSIDVSNNVLLEEIICFGNSITSLEITNSILLEVLRCYNNHLTTLDISQNSNLWFLDCSSNLLTSLDISSNTSLLGLFFGNNSITSIDLIQNINLLSIGCDNNLLTSLDVSHNIDLVAIYIQDNELTSFSINQNQVLEVLNCNNNDLETLYVQNGANYLLTGTYTSGNGQEYNRFRAADNPNLTCIFVDDATYCMENWTEVDPASTFVETQTECDALDIGNYNLINNIQIYPNPVEEILFIEYSEGNFIIIKLFNLIGDEILSTKNNHIDVKSITSGIYLIKVITENNKVFTKKIIIE